jgi:hypothetical protein
VQVWRGGVCILALAVFVTDGHGDSVRRGDGGAQPGTKPRRLPAQARRVFAVDSFAGLPPPNADLFPVDDGDSLFKFSGILGVPQETVLLSSCLIGITFLYTGRRGPPTSSSLSTRTEVALSSSQIVPVCICH